jgi:hypothetical protein
MRSRKDPSVQDMMMSVPPISSPQPIPQATTDTTRPQDRSNGSAANAADSNATTGQEDSRPTQSSSTAPGTGLIVDKFV